MPCRVYIADDVEPLRRLWRTYLCEDPDIEIVGEAADGAEALEGVRATEPDVLLLDLSMPRVDGLEVIRALREEAPHIRIVVASGFSGTRLTPVALELGAVSYFQKGGSAAELRDAVTSACASAPRLRERSPSTDG